MTRGRLHTFADPGSLAFADPLLFVYDARSSRVWTLDVNEPGAAPRSDFTPFKTTPSHLAVSPDGDVVATIEVEYIVFRKRGVESIRYQGKQFTDVVGVTFAS